MKLFTPASPDDFGRLLKAWRFWLVAALLGGLLGAAIHVFSPPPYRARASVQVDFNIEEAYKPTQDKQSFYYLEREVRKLEALAFSDAVMQSVADNVRDVTIAQLRDGILRLSQPVDADWHFFAEDSDPERASRLASAWAEAFTAQLRDAVTASITLQSFHATLENGCGGDCAEIEPRIAELETRAQGISPYIEVSLLQTQQLPTAPRIALSTYILIGAVVAWSLGALLVLFLSPWGKNGASANGQ
jgi:hypothetical protein